MLGAAFLAARVLGLVRVTVIGAEFGAGPDLDAYFAAFRIPDTIFQLAAAGALATALVPVTAGLVATGDERRAWRVVSSVAALMLAIMVGLALLAAFAAPGLLRAALPDFRPAQLDRTVELTRIMLAAPILLGLGTVATATLNSVGLFAASGLAPTVYNLGIIGGAVLLAPIIGVDGLAIGVVVGSLGHLAVQLPQLRRIGFTPSFDLGDPATREAVALLVPRAIGLGASQLIFLASTALAQGLGTGAISVFNVAFTVFQIPIGIIGVSLGTALLPSLSRATATGDIERFSALIGRSLRVLLFIMIPLTGLMIALAEPGVALLFRHGRFAVVDVSRTADTVRFFAIGLAGETLIAVLARAFYARRDTRTPVAAALVTVVVDVVLSVALVGPLGVTGLALAIAVGSWIETAILVALLVRRAPATTLAGLGTGALIFAVGSLIASAAALGADTVLARLVGGSVPALVGRLAVDGLIAAGIYAGYGLLLRLPELADVLAIVRRRPAAADTLPPEPPAPTEELIT